MAPKLRYCNKVGIRNGYPSYGHLRMVVDGETVEKATTLLPTFGQQIRSILNLLRQSNCVWRSSWAKCHDYKEQRSHIHWLRRGRQTWRVHISCHDASVHPMGRRRYRRFRCDDERAWPRDVGTARPRNEPLINNLCLRFPVCRSICSSIIPFGRICIHRVHDESFFPFLSFASKRLLESNSIQQVVHPELWHQNRHHKNKVRIHNIIILATRVKMESPESVIGKTDIASGNHVHYVSYPRDGDMPHCTTAYLISRIRCNNILIWILLHLILEIRYAPPQSPSIWLNQH